MRRTDLTASLSKNMRTLVNMAMKFTNSRLQSYLFPHNLISFTQIIHRHSTQLWTSSICPKNEHLFAGRFERVTNTEFLCWKSLAFKYKYFLKIALSFGILNLFTYKIKFAICLLTNTKHSFTYHIVNLNWWRVLQSDRAYPGVRDRWRCRIQATKEIKCMPLSYN